MPSDPTNIGHASEFVVWVHVEYVFHGHGSAEEIARSRMYDAFWFTCRPRGLCACKDIKYGNVNYKCCSRRE